MFGLALLPSTHRYLVHSSGKLNALREIGKNAADRMLTILLICYAVTLGRPLSEGSGGEGHLAVKTRCESLFPLPIAAGLWAHEPLSPVKPN